MNLGTLSSKYKRAATIPAHLFWALVVSGIVAVFLGPGALFVVAPLYYIAKRNGVL